MCLVFHFEINEWSQYIAVGRFQKIYVFKTHGMMQRRISRLPDTIFFQHPGIEVWQAGMQACTHAQLQDVYGSRVTNGMQAIDSRVVPCS